jgi:outer membrane protein
MKRIVALTITMLLLAVLPALAQTAKLGYVDLQKALNMSSSGQSAKAQIGERVKEYEGEVQSRQAELKKMKEDLEKQAVLLSEEARGKKEREYQQKLKEFQRFTKDIQEELQQKDADATRRILEELFGVIKKYGADNDFTMIFEKTESSVLYADDQVDLTEDIIKAYDAQNK